MTASCRSDCKWRNPDEGGCFDGICLNPDSEYAADYCPDYGCEKEETNDVAENG